MHQPAPMTRPYQCLKKIAGLLIAGLYFFCPGTDAQVLSLPHAYAHNDYWHKRPLLDALDNGFTHVEADIYLRHSRLVVSHNPPFLGHRRTLESLYFRPLLQRFTSDGECQQSPLDTIVLMIDIKSKGVRTIKALNRLLERYKPVLTSCEDGKLTIRNLTLVITGHRPMVWLEKDGPRYLFVDADLNRLDRRRTLPDLYFTASCRYSRLISWKGRGQIPTSDQQRLTALVGQAHAMGAKVRLWGSPDKPRIWNFLISCGVDLINTDRLVALKNYFIRNNQDDHSEVVLSPGQ